MLPPVPLRTRLTLLAASSLTVMAGAIVAPALPQIAAVFETQVEHADFLAKMVLAVPALAIAVFAPISGWFVDRFGCRPLLLAGLALYALAGTSGIYLADAYLILAGRLLLGAAVAMVMTATTTLVSNYFHGTERGRFLGLQATSMALGGVVFLPLGGLLADLGGWHWPFAVYVASLPILLAAARALPEPVRVTVLPGEAPAPGQSSGEHELRVRWRPVALIYAISFVGMGVFYLGPPQLPFYMKTRFGSESLVASLSVATMSACAAVTSTLYSRLVRRFGSTALLVAFFVLLGGGFAVVGSAPDMLGVWVGLVLAGLGGGLFSPTLTNWLMRVAPPAYRGRLSGGMISAMFAGQFLSPILALPLVRAGGPALAFVACGLALAALGLGYAGVHLAVARRRARQRWKRLTFVAPSCSSKR